VDTWQQIEEIQQMEHYMDHTPDLQFEEQLEDEELDGEKEEEDSMS
jgi:hypothetical protein